MMNTWWDAREPRERLIIIIGGVIAGFLALYQFVMAPSSDFRERAERRYSNALAENFDILTAITTRSSSAEAPSRNQPLQTVVTNSSDLYGMTITRLIPAENEGLNIWLEAEGPETVFAWLSELERTHGVRVGRASLRRNSDEQTISANVYLARGG